MKADGSGAITITLPGERAYYNPVWSPDGKRIAFVAFKFPGGEDIMIVNDDATNPQLVVAPNS
jgi:Tol biopolymer transport system component